MASYECPRSLLVSFTYWDVSEAPPCCPRIGTAHTLSAELYSAVWRTPACPFLPLQMDIGVGGLQFRALGNEAVVNILWQVFCANVFISFG